MPVPEDFSFIEHPKVVMDFFFVMGRYLRNEQPITIDFRKVTRINPCALTILLAKINTPRYTHFTKIRLYKPTDKKLDQLLDESGFYNYIQDKEHEIKQGCIYTRKNTKVDPEMAKAVRKLTAEKTFGYDKKLPALYRTLIECMANTHDHAANNQPGIRERWYLSVYSDPDTKITKFSFCDTGVGIFKSRPVKKIFASFAQKWGLKKPNSEVLMQILNGELISATGLKNRGKGLPKIYQDFQNGSLKHLHIAANDVFSALNGGTFIELNRPLQGTFLYWEITPN